MAAVAGATAQGKALSITAGPFMGMSASLTSWKFKMMMPPSSLAQVGRRFFVCKRQ